MVNQQQKQKRLLYEKQLMIVSSSKNFGQKNYENEDLEMKAMTISKTLVTYQIRWESKR